MNLQELSEESRRAAVNEKDSEGYAALHRAVKEGDIKEMERLILIGAGKVTISLYHKHVLRVYEFVMY